MTAGVFPGLSYADYVRLPGLRSSYLQGFAKTPKHAHHRAQWEPEPTKAMELGTAIHTAILEPEQFEKRFAVKPEGLDRRFNEGKAAWVTFLAEHGHKTQLERDAWDTALRCRDAVWEMPWAKALLGGRGGSELCVRWDDAEFKTPCKARLDRFAADFEGLPTVCDLKSTRDAGKDSFKADVERFGYGLQAAYYLDGLAAATAPHFRRWLWIAVETAPPYACALREPTEAVIAEGRRLYRTAIGLHMECERTGSWPGYPDHAEMIDRPAWAVRKQEDSLL